MELHPPLHGERINCNPWYPPSNEIGHCNSPYFSIRSPFSQEVGLKHFYDLLDRMPRVEASEIVDVVHAAVTDQIGEGFIVEGCGSFRRGKATCGDVDVLVTHSDGKSHGKVFPHLLKHLESTGEEEKICVWKLFKYLVRFLIWFQDFSPNIWLVLRRTEIRRNISVSAACPGLDIKLVSPKF